MKNAFAVEKMVSNLLDFARTATLGEYLQFVEEVRKKAGDNAADLAIKAMELSLGKIAV
jgi:hypothetical protein